MIMKMNFVVLVVILAGSAFAVTLEEVQKMKKELEQGTSTGLFLSFFCVGFRLRFQLQNYRLLGWLLIQYYSKHLH